jgi:hypothetical protein
MAKRRCKGKTKAGKRCKAWALHDGDRCLAHSDEKTQDSVGFGGSQPDAGRPAKPRVVDVLRERVEAEVEKIVAPYFEALEHAVLHATYEGEVVVSEHADLGARINAAEKLLDRVYGKPRQTIEHAGAQDGAAVPVELNLDQKTREAIAGALRRRPAAGSE